MKVVCCVWVMVMSSVLQVQIVNGKRDQALFCSVCRAVVEEIGVRIDEVDPKKTVRVGSYRMDSQGNQKLAEVKYATSDLHLTEILDDVCQSFKDYGKLRDQSTERDSVVRMKTRDGKELDTSTTQSSPKLRETFETYCEELIEETEDDIMKIFKQEDRQSIESQLCGETAGACSEEDLQHPLPHLEEKVGGGPGLINSFHVIPPDGAPEAVQGVQSVEDLKNKILEVASQTNRQDDGEECDRDDDDDDDDDSRGRLDDEL